MCCKLSLFTSFVLQQTNKSKMRTLIKHQELHQHSLLKKELRIIFTRNYITLYCLRMSVDANLCIITVNTFDLFDLEPFFTFILNTTRFFQCFACIELKRVWFLKRICVGYSFSPSTIYYIMESNH